MKNLNLLHLQSLTHKIRLVLIKIIKMFFLGKKKNILYGILLIYSFMKF